MEEIPVSLEVLDHARGAIIFDNGELDAKPGIAGYQCKLYRARLSLSSASRHTHANSSIMMSLDRWKPHGSKAQRSSAY